MLKEVKLDEAIGKTLKAFAFEGYGCQMVLVFDDGTFTTLEAQRDRDGDSTIDQSTLDVLSFNRTALVNAGVGTDQELHAMATERDRQWREQREAHDRAELARLQAKFGGVKPAA